MNPSPAPKCPPFDAMSERMKRLLAVSKEMERDIPDNDSATRALAADLRSICAEVARLREELAAKQLIYQEQSLRLIGERVAAEKERDEAVALLKGAGVMLMEVQEVAPFTRWAAGKYREIRAFLAALKESTDKEGES